MSGAFGAMELLDQLRAVIREKDTTIERQEATICGLREQAERLRLEIERLEAEAESYRSLFERKTEKATTDVENRRTSPRSESLRKVNVRETVENIEERRKSIEMEAILFPRHSNAAAAETATVIEKKKNAIKTAEVTSIDEKKSAVTEATLMEPIEEEQAINCGRHRERRRSDSSQPTQNRRGLGARRNTVTERPEHPFFMQAGRRRRLTTRRGRLPPVDRTSKTWQGSYALSPDMDIRLREKILNELSRKYGGGDLECVQAAARVIQTCYRSFVMRRRLTFIRAIPARERKRTRTLPNFAKPDVTGYPSLLEEARKANRHRHLLPSRSLSQSPTSAVAAAATTVTQSIREGVDEEEEVGETTTDGRIGDTRAAAAAIERTTAPTVIIESAATATMAPIDLSAADSSSSLIMRNLKPHASAEDFDDVSEISSVVSVAYNDDDDDEDDEIGNGNHHESVTRKISRASLLSSATILSDVSDVLPSPPNVSCVSRESRTEAQRIWQLGVNHFNRKPNKGVFFLVSRSLVEDSPVAVAEFLLRRKGLSKLKIGEYVGDPSDFNIAVLQEFARAISLKDMTFVAALRKFQSHFILPGEAQKIERIIEAFAAQYTACNPRAVSDSQDTIFVLAYSVIMLNTDLHNANVKRKMTKEQFVHNNRGIDNGKNLPKFFLENVYDEIEKVSLAPATDHTTEVERVEKSISGLPDRLTVPFRQLVHMTQLNQVVDPYRRQSKNDHPRFVFLFNDLLLLVKLNPKRLRAEHLYHFKSSLPLCGLSFKTFQTEYYKYGITLKTSYNDQTQHFCASSAKVQESLLRDLFELLREVDDMENERLAELKRATMKSSSQFKNAMDDASGKNSSGGSLRSPRATSVTLSPQFQRRVFGDTGKVVSSYLDVDGRSTSIPADLNVLRDEGYSLGASRSPSPADSGFRSGKATSPSPSVQSNGSTLKGSFLKFKKSKKL